MSNDTLLPAGTFAGHIGERTFDDADLFGKAAGEWRSSKVETRPGRRVWTADTISHSKTISVPQHWSAMTKAAKRGNQSPTKLTPEEQEWLGANVSFSVKAHRPDGNGVDYFGQTGQVWALSTIGSVWVVLDNATSKGGGAAFESVPTASLTRI